MKPDNTPISIFLYNDYRKFLRDWYQFAKKNRRGFSFRAFSQKAGFSSPNFLKRVMDGDRNLTLESLPKCAEGLGLNKQETEFFKNLVLFTQSPAHEEKDLYYEQMIRSRKFAELKPLEKDQYEYYSAWYNPVIRELVVSPDFDGTADWLARRINPPITVPQATRSLELLTRMGFIKKVVMKRESGFARSSEYPGGMGEASGQSPIITDRWFQAQPLVTTGPEALALSIVNYHQNVLELVKHQLPRVRAVERDVSALTLGIKKGRLGELKKKIQDFRREILKMVAEDTEPEEVVVMAIQMLPVTMER